MYHKVITDYKEEIDCILLENLNILCNNKENFNIAEFVSYFKTFSGISSHGLPGVWWVAYLTLIGSVVTFCSSCWDIRLIIWLYTYIIIVAFQLC